jgi:O-antigen ligase
MDRLSRIVVLCSLLAAVALQARLGARDYGPLAGQVPAALALGLSAALVAPAATTAIVLVFTYIAPLALGVTIGRYHSTFILIWIAAMLGVVLASGLERGWRLPPRWRWPLIAVALVVAIGWPIVIWRETDFNLALLDNYRVANTSVGVAPPVASIGILDTAITHLLGLLWFDCLYARYAENTSHRFVRFVALPLGISAALSCALSCYQAFVDLTFWASGAWALLRRASGTMLDANISGMVAACWMSGFVAMAGAWQGRRRMIATGAGVLLTFAAVWASGSRTALLAALVGAGFALAGAVRQTAAAARRRTILLIGASAAAGIALFAVLPLPTIGPLERLRAGIHSAGAAGPAGVLISLWDRDAYGSASTRAIRDTPLFGVGVGAFTLLSIDYVRAGGGPDVPFDNAQNWFRHQLAELGIVGCAGWLLWTVLFAGTLIRGRAHNGNAVAAASLKGALLGLTGASMLGVPSLSPAITLTFWTFAFWYLGLLVNREQEEARTLRLFERRGAGWVFVTSVVLAYALGTVYVAKKDLSVPKRAQRFGWNYNYGFHGLENAERPFRWTAREGVMVVPVGGRTFVLKIWSADPDVRRQPVHAKVWVDGRLVLDERLAHPFPIERRIELPPGEKRMIVRTWVNRTWSPRMQGSHDSRELGLAVGDWVFQD